MSLSPIHTLLSTRSPEEWQSYWSACGKKTSDFPAYVSGLIKSMESQNAQRLILFNESRYDFLAGFLAAAHLGVPIILPPNNTSGTLKEVMKPGDLQFSHLLPEPAQKYTLTDIPTCFPNKVSLCFYTSGSAGAPKPIYKSLDQLEAEVSTLDKTWTLKGKVLSTVSHQHIYGLLFSLLWPVSRGIPLALNTFAFWEELFQGGEPNSIIVSSPAHLGRFPVDMEVHSPPSYVFSSGGPLSPQSNLSTQKALGTTPWEVYGSTETGGIAFRQAHTPGQHWTPFPGVELFVRNNQTLLLKSPHLPNHDLYETQDRVELLATNQFNLLGRTDRTVKIEGKRLDLNELEGRLKSIEDVADAMGFTVTDNQKSVLVAVAALTPSGKDLLKELGQFKFSLQLKQYLRQFLDPVLIPKRWRFVDHIPTNSQGKKSPSELKKLFDRALGAVRNPHILSFSENPASVELTLHIPRDLAYFDGHFDNHPIVPGVVQLHWAFEYAKTQFNIQGLVMQGNRIKFNRIMQPETTVQLTLEHDQDEKTITYAYTDKDGKYSSGQFVYLGCEEPDV